MVPTGLGTWCGARRGTQSQRRCLRFFKNKIRIYIFKIDMYYFFQMVTKPLGHEYVPGRLDLILHKQNHRVFLLAEEFVRES